MEKIFKVFAGFVFAAIIGFSLTGCSEGGGGGGGTTQPVFSVSGEFNGATNGKALFQAKTDETVSRSARSAVSTYELTGELEDGDMVFRLRGTYDSSSGSYTVSSASSFARYTVSGNESGATATLAVKDTINDTWQSFVVSVTIKEVTVKDDEVQAEEEGGLPAWARGSWHDWWTEDTSNYNYNSMEAWSYFDQWYYEAYRNGVWKDNWDCTVTKYTVINATEVSDGVYDVIFSYPLYRADKDQKMAALKQFFEEKKHPAEPWNYEFAPWDHSVWKQTEDWEQTEANEEGMNYDNSVIWYICMEEQSDSNNHSGGGLKIINWETFYKFFVDKHGDDIDEESGKKVVDIEIEKVYGSAWVSDEATRWEKKDAVEAYFKDELEGMSNYYYYGWFEDDWEAVDGDSEKLKYSCWVPVCEDVNNDGSWWNNKTRYFSKWGNQTGIQGDWTQFGDIFQKWNEENYLVNYLRGKNVEPETWYTRVRMSKDNETLVVQYYNGDKEAESDKHSAPACDTKSLSKIQGLTFDSNYFDWSYFWYPPQRTVPRTND